MIRIRSALAALGLFLAQPGFAAEPPPAVPAPRIAVAAQPLATPARAPSDIARLALNKTTEILLPAPVRDIVVGNPDVVDALVRSPTQVLLAARGVGQTDVTFFDATGTVMRRIAVDVHVDAEALKAVLAQVLPDETRIRVSGVGDSIYLAGTVKSDVAVVNARSLARRFVKDDANVVNLLRVSAEQQVMLQVKVAEMQKTVLKELGVGLSGPIARMGDQVANIATASTIGLTQSASQLFGTVSVTGISSLVASLSALERQGLIRTLVEPNLTAVSGETANLLAGGEFPIPVAEDLGKISIEFKQFGVLLNFTPVVLDPGRISLKMQSEVSAIDSSLTVTLSSTQIPGLSVRRASSTVEMPSGGSIMIAGLLQNDITSTLSGMPGLMDVPVLGALFKSTSFQRKETELVVIVSAYVVQPLEKPGLALPTDGFAPSSDLDRILLNRLQETYLSGRAGAAVAPELQGPVGYIVQ
ncbi:type II and III secretion system protein family protein [Magnetospirillum sp. UT-4]|uniref:type II and III secretion system protein family protein n=1 Tax=Magnetospirillum sp. UT-4 TaxID=2681467 RepID=UPI00137F4D89|nr:type II and III secretion system protein family protein [Magnetospirillum sp. UT-4]CAA7625884.1 Type II and III secretion system protein [Magnetospirillum sp. UT-4]